MSDTVIFEKPMLAVNAPDLLKVNYPVLCSPKLDGVRCVTPYGHAKTRNDKPISNAFIRDQIERDPMARHLDGELVTLDSGGKIKSFNECSGDIRRQGGRPNWEFLVFDSISPQILGLGFTDRLAFAEEQIRGHHHIRLVPHVLVEDIDQLTEFEAYCVAEGFEGVMIRDPHGPYKFGRSTAREGYLLKVKRFEDAEGQVIGWSPLVDKNGVTDYGRAGVLSLRTTLWGDIEVGSGFTDAQRKDIARSFFDWNGEMVTFKFQPSGMVSKPRFPVFKGIRQEGT